MSSKVVSTLPVYTLFTYATATCFLIDSHNRKIAFVLVSNISICESFRRSRCHRFTTFIGYNFRAQQRPQNFQLCTTIAIDNCLIHISIERINQYKLAQSELQN